MWAKFFSLSLIIFGEALTIFAEVYGARLTASAGDARWSSYAGILVAVTLGSWCLLGGYMAGMRAFQDIWIVTAVSLTTILIIEPTLTLGLFGTVPTRQAAIGLALGVMGLTVALWE